MKEIKLVYKGKKSKVILNFDFKGKLVAEKGKIYSSNDCKLLQDEEIVEILTKRYNFEIFENEEIEEKPKKKKKKTNTEDEFVALTPIAIEELLKGE